MDEHIFLRGYIIIGAATLITTAMVIFLGKWWAYPLALLAECLVSGALQDLKPRMLRTTGRPRTPETMRLIGRCRRQCSGGGFRLGIDSEYPYRDQKLVEDWRNFPQTTNGAAIFIWLISVARAVLEIDV